MTTETTLTPLQRTMERALLVESMIQSMEFHMHSLPEDMTPEEMREEGLPEGIEMPMILVNPELTLSGKTTKSEEGCLSVPNSYRASVPRHTAAHLKMLDLEGNVIEMDTHGLFAICLQHEIDHLDGKLFIDYISRLKLNLYKASLRKQGKA